MVNDEKKFTKRKKPTKTRVNFVNQNQSLKPKNY